MPKKQGRGGNPAKHAVQVVEQRQGIGRPSAAKKGANEKSKRIAIYHEMRVTEDFETTADMLFQMVQKAAKEYPASKRALHLDIEGHRNSEGGLDSEAFELVKHFLIGYLMQWLTELSTPLGSYGNPSQREDIPEHLNILPGGGPNERQEMLRNTAEALGGSVFDSETGETVNHNGSRFRL